MDHDNRLYYVYVIMSMNLEYKENNFVLHVEILELKKKTEQRFLLSYVCIEQ
jgi:hypothetical protein